MSWMTQTEAAAALGCSIRTIRRRIRSGTMDARRDGRHLMVQVDTDKAMATVTQVGRQLAEVGAAAAIQRKQDTDALATIHSTFKDTLSALDTYRERAEREVQSYRRSARWGWGMAAVLAVVLVAGGWLIHAQQVDRDRKIHQMESSVLSIKNASETAIVTSEIRHAGEMTTQTAKYEATSAAMREALTHERHTVAALDQRIADAQVALAAQTAELQAAREERDRLAWANDGTVLRLQSALALSRLKGTIKSLWSELQSTDDRSGGVRQSEEIRGAFQNLAAAFQADLARAEENRRLEISQIIDRQDEIAASLQSALLEKEAAQQRLEQRNDELADKLIAAVTERSYLAAEQERLARENADLRDKLTRAEQSKEATASPESANAEPTTTTVPRNTYGPTTTPRSNHEYGWQARRDGKNAAPAD